MTIFDWKPFLYDAASVLIVLIAVWIGAKNGFTKTFVQTVGFVLSIVAAVTVGKIASSLLYTTLLQPLLRTTLENSLANAVDPETVIEGLKNAVAGLPAISALLFDFSAVEESLTESVTLKTEEIAATVEETVLRPVIEPLLEMILFVLVLLILLAVVSLLAKGSKSVNEVPVIGKVNAFFGGLVGFINGVVLLFAAAAILNVFIHLNGATEYVSEPLIGKSLFFHYIYELLCGKLLA